MKGDANQSRRTTTLAVVLCATVLLAALPRAFPSGAAASAPCKEPRLLPSQRPGLSSLFRRSPADSLLAAAAWPRAPSSAGTALGGRGSP